VPNHRPDIRNDRQRFQNTPGRRIDQCGCADLHPADFNQTDQQRGYTDKLVLLLALRAIYYMGLLGMPWTSKTLYGWLKENLGGFDISTTDLYDHWGGQMYSGTGDNRINTFSVLKMS
jgi:hypothetical protein